MVEWLKYQCCFSVCQCEGCREHTLLGAVQTGPASGEHGWGAGKEKETQHAFGGLLHSHHGSQSLRALLWVQVRPKTYQAHILLTWTCTVFHPNIFQHILNDAALISECFATVCMKRSAKCFLLFMRRFSDEYVIMMFCFWNAFCLSQSQTNPSRMCSLVSHNPWCLVMLSSIS